jgi:hypothetical protein
MVCDGDLKERARRSDGNSARSSLDSANFGFFVLARRLRVLGPPNQQIFEQSQSAQNENMSMFRPLIAVVLLAAVHAATADCPVPPILNDFSMAKVRPLQPHRREIKLIIGWPNAHWILFWFVYSRIPRVASCCASQLETGTWFEIGKFQSGLGAFFEKDCVCTHLTVSPNADGTATASNGARHICTHCLRLMSVCLAPHGSSVPLILPCLTCRIPLLF